MIVVIPNCNARHTLSDSARRLIVDCLLHSGNIVGRPMFANQFDPMRICGRFFGTGRHAHNDCVHCDTTDHVAQHTVHSHFVARTATNTVCIADAHSQQRLIDTFGVIHMTN